MRSIIWVKYDLLRLDLVLDNLILTSYFLIIFDAHNLYL